MYYAIPQTIKIVQIPIFVLNAIIFHCYFLNVHVIVQVFVVTHMPDICYILVINKINPAVEMFFYQYHFSTAP